MLPRHILVAIDVGEMSRPVFDYARELARSFDGTLHVMHVAGNVVAAAIGVEGFTADFGAVQRAIEDAAHRQLADLVTAADRRTLHATTVVRSSNAPAEAIVEYAREAGIDLVIVGAHGSAMTPHMVMGSIAERVVRTAPCPVLTVRSVAVPSASRAASAAVLA
jgi:nucleotide-binding universal stress UspA family protein